VQQQFKQPEQRKHKLMRQLLQLQQKVRGQPLSLQRISQRMMR
jgi:hypothetical protein